MAENPTEQAQGYRLAPYRYVNLLVFVGAALVNGLPASVFASINTLVEKQFHYSPLVVAMNILLSAIAHPLVATPINMTLDKCGVRVGCSIGGVLVIIGVWLRSLMQVDNPLLVTAGSLFYALGNLFILSSPSIFAIRWFPHEAAPKIISATVLINFLSNGIGAAIAGLFLHPTSTSDDIRRFMRLEAIIVTVPFILFFLLFREKPEHPPSKAAAKSQQNQATVKKPYIQTIKQLVSNRSYLKIVLSMSFSYGMFLSYVSVLNKCLDIIGYKNPGLVSSVTFGSAIALGAFSAFGFSYAIRVTLRYKTIISLCLLGATLTFGLMQFAFSMKVQSLAVIAAMAGCTGFFVIPVTALFTMYSSELTFPLPQGSATGYLFAGSQTVGFLSGLAWAAVLDENHKWKAYLLFAGHTLFIGLSLLVNLSARQELNKTNYEKGVKTAQGSETMIDSLISAEGQKNQGS